MKKRTTNVKTRTLEKPEEMEAQPKPATPTPEQIQERAYEIFVVRGREGGHELDDWLQAEIELNSRVGRRGGNTAN